MILHACKQRPLVINRNAGWGSNDRKSSKGWKQLGFPSVFSMDLDGCRWIYKTEDGLFDVILGTVSPLVGLTALVFQGERYLTMDVESIAAALLHDVIEDTPATKEDIENMPYLW